MVSNENMKIIFNAVEKTYLTLNKVDAYLISFRLSNYIWEVVLKWEKFEKWTIGKQLTESADSISANIAEGFGRYHKKEKIHFYRYSYGSMEETKDWIRKVTLRNLLSNDEKTKILSDLQKLPFAINQLIKYTNQKLKHQR